MNGIDTPLTRLLGIRRPVLLAGMAGGPTTPELVAAVSRAGGLGVFGLAGMQPDAVHSAVRAAVEMSGGTPVGVNVLISPEIARPGADPARMDAVLAGMRARMGLPHPPPPPPPAASPRELAEAGIDAGASVVATGLGDPSVVADIARAAGAPLIAMASTVRDAVRMVQSGADAVVAQGSEAGGHRSNIDVPEDSAVPLVGTLALVRQVVRAVDVPVVAAGGIMDGAGVAAALALGATGAQLGTAFLVADEAGVPPGWRGKLRDATDDGTVITRSLSGRPARGLPNAITRALEVPGALGWPGQNAATADVRRAAAAADDPDHMALWAGQAAALAGPDRPARRIMDSLIDEARATMQRLGEMAAR